MSARDLQVFAALDEEASKYISGAIKRLNLSARAYERVLKVSRTIADLAGEERIDRRHIAEALS